MPATWVLALITLAGSRAADAARVLAVWGQKPFPPGEPARVLDPHGTAFDPASGRAFVADTGGGRVLWWRSAGRLRAGAEPDGELRVPGLAPAALAVGPEGKLWVCDPESGRVWEFDAGGGSPRALSRTDAGPLREPLGIAAGGDGSAWVSDATLGRVFRFPGGREPGGTELAALRRPAGLAFDGTGRLWVAESGGDSALAFRLGPDGAEPEGEAGAGRLCSPFALASAGDRLWVSDPECHRVLGVSQEEGGLLFGQDGPDGRYPNRGRPEPSTGSLSHPLGLAVDPEGALWIADSGNDRLLALAPGAPEAAAVLGRPPARWRPAQASPNGLRRPYTLTHGPDGRVWLSDEGNDRVLFWRSADRILEGRPPDGALGPAVRAGPAARLSEPGKAAVDARGRVWLPDSGNDRLLRFDAPARPDPEPAVVPGAGLRFPQTAVFGPDGALWLADSEHHRVLRFSSPTAAAETDLVLGQADFAGVLPNRGGAVAADGLAAPDGLAFDAGGALWVADYDNSRVLRFTPPFAAGMRADLALGQNDLGSGLRNRGGPAGAGTLALPGSLGFDPAGRLWVADTDNNRVLGFSPPFQTGMRAERVLGQADFLSRDPNRGGPPAPDSLYTPTDAAPDGRGRIWVVDSINDRIAVFDPDAPAR